MKTNDDILFKLSSDQKERLFFLLLSFRVLTTLLINSGMSPTELADYCTLNFDHIVGNKNDDSINFLINSQIKEFFETQYEKDES